MGKQILLIGNGTSANRFASILLRKGHRVFVFIHRPNLHIPPSAKPIRSLKRLQEIDAAIIASPPHTHARYAQSILKQRIPLLIEKPIATTLPQSRKILDEVRKMKTFAMVGFNLRYLPIVNKIHELIKRKKIGEIYYAKIQAGYTLPRWRPRKNYRKTYSAHYKLGGGVALDLIHEIDLALHWFGHLRKISIFSEKLSRLDIDCEDYVSIQSTEPFPVHITLDYLSDIHTRRYMIVGSNGTITCDIYQNYFEFTSGNRRIMLKKKSYFDIQQTYTSEVSSFLSKLEQKEKNINQRSLGIDALALALKARKYVPR